MIETPTCPGCGDRQWRAIGSRTYRLVDSARLSSYVQKRFRVLFEIWFPMAREVTLTSRLCEYCGFITYTPRPTVHDLDAKYRFLNSLGADLNTPSVDSPNEIQRARLLFGYLHPHLPALHPSEIRILDFGGGDGRLLREFLAMGCGCDLVDYSQRTVPGVRRIGTTLSDVAPEPRYHLIVCSHVIEHLADPFQVLSNLRQHLDSGGTLYVEVPMEIWGRAPLHEEPVTHVNFFTPASLRFLLERTGLRVSTCRLGCYPHPTGQTKLAIRALARPTASRELTLLPPEGAREAQRFLRPGLGLKLRRRWLTPATLPAAIAYRMKRLMGGR